MFKSILCYALTLAMTMISFSSSFSFEPADQSEVNFYNSRLIPSPRSVEYGRGVVVFNTHLRCELVLPTEFLDDAKAEGQIDSVRATVSKYFNTDVKFNSKSVDAFLNEIQSDSAFDSAREKLGDLLKDDAFWRQSNAYRVVAIPDPQTPGDGDPDEIVARQNEVAGRLVVAATDLAGLRDSFKTLRQLAETFSDTASTETSRYFIPELTLDDAPGLAFRGMHLCWFPETRADFIERSIRIAAYYKFNHIVLEFWGVFPFESCDALCWSDIRTTKDEVRRLVALGKSLGVDLIPQFNLFGHAPGARAASGKHTILGDHPEFEPLFEPDGWTWNVYNPAARELLANCVLELYETFDRPAFFHIGCDEADSAGTSFIARRKGNYVAALADWLTYFHDLLQERNCRVMMWHDMLVGRSEFPGYTANGDARTQGILDKLPKDIVICDWQYNAPKENETWPTTNRFLDSGFDVVLCPWRNSKGIRSLGQAAVDKNTFGLLCTTWHIFFGDDMRAILTVGANVAWRSPGDATANLGAFNRHIRQILSEVEGRDYRTNGIYDWQVGPETITPR